MVALPHVYRPLGSRLAAAVMAFVLVFVVVFLWLSLPAEVQAQFGAVDRATLVVVFALVVVVLYALFRTRAVADERGLTVVNGFHTQRFEWAQLVSISLTPNRPWALIDLDDGTTVSVMALQTADGARASAATRELAAVIAGHNTCDPGT